MQKSSCKEIATHLGKLEDSYDVGVLNLEVVGLPRQPKEAQAELHLIPPPAWSQIWSLRIVRIVRIQMVLRLQGFRVLG